jgi:hypothetical protein
MIAVFMVPKPSLAAGTRPGESTEKKMEGTERIWLALPRQNTPLAPSNKEDNSAFRVVIAFPNASHSSRPIGDGVDSYRLKEVRE